ncbi:MAG: aldo/keto reductase [Actinomyces urogenitalis]|uniref:aldo/keto reductase n=1 Tax=Actinomyces urogenitalis TaxID=103621 RepID=UPI002A7FF42E|nr:aldo/keto reductase [Actinomyces urogenitalis]MDY3679007.1 aldo/keto reductase [Actinomyces urogenitalis]
MSDAIRPLSLPAIGFGTYNLRGRAGAQAVTSAIEVGYRLIDSAFSYENEGCVADGVAGAVEAGLACREEIVVTSKVPGRHYGYEQGLAAVEESASRMRPLGAIDLYLLHWPNPAQNKYVETWRALIEARERGLVRHIGVSNFLPEHIERLEGETGVLPEVNQIESHPLFPNTEQIAYNASRGITTEAWSPLGRKSDILSNPVVAEVAAAHSASPAQAILAWHVARGVTAIPKSSTRARQEENLASASLRLTPEEIGRITALGDGGHRLADQDPATYEEL